MLKWIGGILAIVIGGVLLAYVTHVFDLNGNKHERPEAVTQNPPDDKKKGSEAPEIAVMSPLEYGINLQGYDFDAYGKAAGNEQLCAEMCKNDEKCDAMTYVKPTGLCWLKHGVPPRSTDPNMVSSVKKRDNSPDSM